MMKKYISLLLFLFSGLCFAQKSVVFGLAIHGGAGTIVKAYMSDELEKQYREKLGEALQAGYDTLNKNGTSIDAVVVAIKILEDSPLFNAGKGSVFTADGKNEMDASVMDGKTLKAGAVAGIRTIKNPITAAVCVMNNSEHVMMVGAGAEKFAKTCECETADTSYFFDQKRYDSWKKIKAAENLKPGQCYYNAVEKDYKFGTVGVVALDKAGNLAAGTSTGGMTNKKYGRVGDSPVIGAGTYANNNTCAVSCTGHGEYFIRAVAAYDVSALMEYKKLPLKAAAAEVVMKKLKMQGGEGGLIAIDKKGNITMPFNTAGMYRGFMKSDGSKDVLIYK
jgi:L-asparaginase / beta-aspartyl-peptidase